MTDKEIQTRKQILYQKKVWTEEDEQELALLNLRDIINSVACYNGLVFATEENSFIKKYMGRITDKAKAKAILAEQREFFRTHAIVHVATSVDFEGCVYNSLLWK